ncbi:hypothetical protein PCL_09015 [Purpureocillium lilacinum]|uniref:Required for respiratory growth protein 9, mitochondrial n=2 Tax=Purpureocillium lilacinum TaxID=33203 RepID=A0A2U3EGV6_PURLI|nr:hypothetical protein PCL_09015 [Purpureocillium lilacinum]
MSACASATPGIDASDGGQSEAYETGTAQQRRIRPPRERFLRRGGSGTHWRTPVGLNFLPLHVAPPGVMPAHDSLGFFPFHPRLTLLLGRPPITTPPIRHTTTRVQHTSAMSCACRTAPWRAFVQGLAQVHRLEAAPILRVTRAAAGLAPVAPARLALRRALPAAPLRGDRGFHASSGLRQDAAGAAAAKTHEPPNTTRETEEGLSAEPPSSEQEASSAPAQSKPRRRRRNEDAKLDIDESAARPADGAAPPTKAKRGRKPQPDSSSSPTRNNTHDDDPSAANKPQREAWQTQKAALKEKFPSGWKPRKRLSPDALAGIRALNAQFPDVYTTQALADKFEVSAEAIRRILKSKWQPSAAEEEERQQRWFRRGVQVWEHKAALGVKPPRRWRREGVARDPAYHERRGQAAERERRWEEEEDRRYRERRGGRSGSGGGQQSQQQRP